MMTIDQWLRSPAHYARATRAIHDHDGAHARRGDIGAVCDIDTADGYVIVDFPATGPTRCTPDEIRPARS
jgi:hypothetical protein